MITDKVYNNIAILTSNVNNLDDQFRLLDELVRARMCTGELKMTNKEGDKK